MFKKILIANRGEIALRIARTCREMGVKTVAVYSDLDRKSPFVYFADEAYPLHGIISLETYLDVDKILGVLEHKEEKIPKEIKNLIKEREKARKKKDFSKSDKIREQIRKKGWEVEDSPDGARVRKI